MDKGKILHISRISILILVFSVIMAYSVSLILTNKISQLIIELRYGIFAAAVTFLMFKSWSILAAYDRQQKEQAEWEKQQEVPKA